jgi:membrane associated rhomboid family serine protease
MATFRSRYPGTSFGIGGYFPRGVKWLLIVNVAVFLFLFFLGLIDGRAAQTLVAVLGLQTTGLIRGMIWQPFTYLFLHGGIGHIVFNMLTLWMFGADLERDWGTRRFLNYYFVCGVGAGFCDIALNLLLGRESLTIGSSGAIYGLLLAYGLLYPNRTVFFSLLFPIPAKYFVMIIGAIAFLSSFGPGSGVSNFAHLGGMLFGYGYLRFRRHGINTSSLLASYQQWRRRRLQKKFKVYMREQEKNRDRWVN